MKARFPLDLLSRACVSVTDATDPDCIPAVVLLDSPSLTSTIQVFSSVGGLCLLAEHLPILYPEIPRQATDGAPQTTSTSGKEGPAGGVGHDWVTVQSADELLDVSTCVMGIKNGVVSCIFCILLSCQCQIVPIPGCRK